MQCCWLGRLSIWNRLLIREVVFVPVYDAGKNRQDLLFFFFFLTVNSYLILSIQVSICKDSCY